MVSAPLTVVAVRSVSVMVQVTTVDTAAPAGPVTVVGATLRAFTASVGAVAAAAGVPIATAARTVIIRPNKIPNRARQFVYKVVPQDASCPARCGLTGGDRRRFARCYAKFGDGLRVEGY